MDPIAASLGILGFAILGFLSNRIPIALVAIGVALALFFTGVLSLPEAFAGFGDPTVLFIAALFVVSESLDATGVTAWAGQKVLAAAGSRHTVLLVLICLLVAVLTALISVNGAVAALLPLVVVVAVRSKIPASQLLMPLAFAAHAGSMLALTGTPVNIIVSEFAEENGGRAFSFFEFALVGVPLVVGTILIVLFLGKRVLPERSGVLMPPDLRWLASELRTQYALEPDAPALLGPDRGITEVVVPPRSPLIGMHVFPGMTTPSGDLVILGARRGGDHLIGADVRLLAGDTLLLRGAWDDLERHTQGQDVLAVNATAILRRSVPLARGWKRAVTILLAMVVLLATGLVPPATAGLIAAGALVLTKTVGVDQAYRSISWTTVILVAGMIPLSTAFTSTGAADLIAEWLLAIVGNASAHVALLSICALTIVLGQLISNTATVLVVAPIAIAVATSLDVSVMPFMMALTVAGAASFLTPIATPANLMVMEPGGYRFGDYWKLGLPLALLFLTIATFMVPLIWPFSVTA